MDGKRKAARRRVMFEILEVRQLLAADLTSLAASGPILQAGPAISSEFDGILSAAASPAAAATTPTVATAAAANPSPVNGNSTNLSVLGSENGSDAGLTYTWATTGYAAAPVTYNANGTNAAKNTTATFTAAGNYNFNVTITDTGGQSVVSAVTVPVTLGIFNNTADIGSPALAGSLSYNASSGAYTTTAGGSNIGGTSDQFRDTYITFNVNAQITARVTSVSNTNASAKAGVMFRDSTAANAAYAFVWVSPSNQVTFETRAANGASYSVSAAAGGSPVWVRLTRNGASNNQFSAYYSLNGTAWTQLGTTQTVTMSSAYLAGLAVTSHNTAALNTSVMDNVSVAGLNERGAATLNAGHTTFVADNGQLLRSPFTSTEGNTAVPEAQIAAMKNLGFNTIHLYAEGADANYPNAGSKTPGYEALAVDKIVQYCQDLGLYCIIVSGGSQAWIQDFWKFYAPRYANDTNVIYEVANEPAAAISMAVNESGYSTIRSYAPNMPVLLFTDINEYGTGGGNSAVAAIHTFNTAEFGNANATWNNLAYAFHGYAPLAQETAGVQVILNAGYPVFMTEANGSVWGTNSGGIDIQFTQWLELKQISWITFLHVPTFGVAGDVTDPTQYSNPVAQSGLSWTPDYGTFPAVRGTFSNGGMPWNTTSTYTNNVLTGTLHIEAENYDTGGQGVAYNDTTVGNQGGQYRPGDNVDISTSNDTNGGYAISSTANGEWLEYTINVPQAGYYNLGLRYANATTGASIDVSSLRDGDLTGQLTLPTTGSLTNWSTLLTQIFLGGGQQILKVSIPVGGFNLNWLELTPTPAGQVPTGTYLIVNRASGMALQLDTSTSNVAQQPLASSSTLQQWNLQSQGAGEFVVVSGNNGSYWTTGFRSTLGTGANYAATSIMLRPIGNGYYRIVESDDGLDYEVQNASTTAGALVDQIVYSGLANQQWAVITTSDQIFPTGLVAYRDASGKAQLSWNATTGAVSYNVKRATTLGGPYVTIAANVAGTSYVDASAAPGTAYYYVVSAVNSVARESLNSLEVGLAQPRAQLKFDEGTGTSAADATGDGWTGTLQGGATWSAGLLGNAVSLSGSSQYVSLPTGVVNGLSDFTISVWVNLAANANWSRIFDFGTSTTNYMYLSANANNSGALRFAINSNNSGEQDVNGGTVPLNTWTQVAVTLSGGVATVYVNGSAVSSGAITHNPTSLGATTKNYIGKSQFGDPYLNGKVDDFRIYASALSSGQVNSLYESDLSPSVATAAAANPAAVAAKTTQLSVLGTDSGGEGVLTYMWFLVNAPAPVTFSSNGTNAAKNTTATFTAAGTYNFLVSITDPAGFTATSAVAVSVIPSLASVGVTPSAAPVTVNTTRQYSATGYDQFGLPLAVQPSFIWSVIGGGGSVSASGLFTAPSAAGSSTVQAASGTFIGTATANVTTQAAPGIVNAASATPSPAGTSTALSVLASSSAGESNLTYTWSLTGTPPGAVTFSANATNAAKNSTANFTKAGMYNFVVTITDQLGLTSTSLVNVTVTFGLFTDSVDVGTPAPAGSLSYSAGVYTIKGGGADIWGSADQFRLTSGTLNGDGQMIARITSLGNTNVSAKAGVMFRDSAAANAAYAFLWVSPSNNVEFETRSGNGVSSNYSITVAPGGSPVWVRLVRSGNQFTASYSLNGSSWNAVGTTQTVTMVTAALGGLAVTSHNAGTLTTAVLDNVSMDALPTLATAAAASPSSVTGTTTALSVLGSDSDGGGEPNLIYTWSTTGTPPAPVTFSSNGANAAKNTTATFTKAGSYSFLVTIKDGGNLTTTSAINVTVSQTLTTIVLSPNPATIASGGTRQFTATANDQFATALSLQPAFTWALASGSGSLSGTGLYTAAYAAANPAATVQATSSSIHSNTASVIVTNAAPTVAVAAAASPVMLTTTTLSVGGADVDGGGEANLKYTWATTGTPPASVTFDANGVNASKNAVASFTKAGTYNFQVTIADLGGLSVTSAVQVVVAQTPTSVSVSPGSTSLTNGQSAAYSAAVTDQFGTAIAAPSLNWSLDSGSVGSLSANMYTAPAAGVGSATIRATAGTASNTASVTLTLSAIAGTGGDDTIRLMRNASTGKLDVTINSTTYSADLNPMTTLSIAGQGGADTIIFDFTNGSPLPAGMITLDGTSSTSTLQFVGAVTAFPLTLAAGPFSVASPLALTTLALGGNATFTLAPGGTNTLSLTGLSIVTGATLDLNDNDMVVNGSDPAATLAALVGYLAGGRNGGLWNGTGLASGAAHAQYVSHGATEYTALAAAINGTLPSPYISTFSSAPVTLDSVLVKYTYAGDATLDGVLNIDDYLALDMGSLFGLSGYVNGGFDYAAAVTGTDYQILNTNISRQNGILSAGDVLQTTDVPAPAAPPAASTTASAASTTDAAPAPIDTPATPTIPPPPPSLLYNTSATTAAPADATPPEITATAATLAPPVVPTKNTVTNAPALPHSAPVGTVVVSPAAMPPVSTDDISTPQSPPQAETHAENGRPVQPQPLNPAATNSGEDAPAPPKAQRQRASAIVLPRWSAVQSRGHEMRRNHLSDDPPRGYIQG